MKNEIISQAEKLCANTFGRIESISLYHTQRILEIFRKHEVGTRHFAPTTGYGYDDVGRDTLEKIFADIFHAEAAIVRPHIVSGTHALSLCLFGLLLPGDELLYASGAPYDTMQEVIGIRGDKPGSLKEMGICYRQVELKNDHLDCDAIIAAMSEKTKVVAIQRSRGYALRASLLPSDMAETIQQIHKRFPAAYVMVDNCYGEFVCKEEPTDFGADICVGSLIKNMGGGLAPTGGYLVGTQKAVQRIAARLTAPGIGLEEGSYAAGYQPFYQGLFLAPHVVAQAMKTAVFAAAVANLLQLQTIPAVNDERADIIQALVLNSPESMIAFCEGIQMASPIDSMAMPEPWDMPGYANQVIMAAGTFVSGASIELSADGPIREPYAVYLQGGLTYEHGKSAVISAFEQVMKRMR